MKNKKRLFIVLIALWILLMIFDFIRFNNGKSKPIICIYSKEVEGVMGGLRHGTKKNYGIGYSFHEEYSFTDDSEMGAIALYIPTFNKFELFYIIPIKEF